MEKRNKTQTGLLATLGVDPNSFNVISEAKRLLSSLSEEQIEELHNNILNIFQSWYEQHGEERQPIGLFDTVFPADTNSDTGLILRPWLHAGPYIADPAGLLQHIQSTGFAPLEELLDTQPLPYLFAILALHQLSFVTFENFHSGFSSIGKDDVMSAQRAIELANSLSMNTFQQSQAERHAAEIGRNKYEEGKRDRINRLASKGGVAANNYHKEYREYISSLVRGKTFSNLTEFKDELFNQIRANCPEMFEKSFILPAHLAGTDEGIEKEDQMRKKLYDVLLKLKNSGVIISEKSNK